MMLGGFINLPQQTHLVLVKSLGDRGSVPGSEYLWLKQEAPVSIPGLVVGHDNRSVVL